jgi:hypothetical protein
MRSAASSSFFPIAFLLSIGGCHRTKHYEANVEISRVAVVDRDDQGRPTATDVEITYALCPGDQIEVVRGGPEFSQCVSKLTVGARVPVKIIHEWDPEGFWDHDVYEVDGCKRPPDRRDEDSFKMVRQCSDWDVNGTRVGFNCEYANKSVLEKTCPWFRRR